MGRASKRLVKPVQSAPKSPKPTNRQSAQHPTSQIGNLVFPSGETTFKALLSARFCSAVWSNISDCDETYNYWEPMHYLIFGTGMQTWEYSPEFALRSYAYLLTHAVPGYIYHKLLQPNPILIFYFLRCLLGLIAALVEVYFYKAVCREFGVHVGRLTLAFSLFSAGMFISTTAFLPSSFAMYGLMGCCAAWWHKRYPLAIFLVGLSALLGWPFAALLGVPVAVDMLLIQKMWKKFTSWTIITAVVILGPMIAIDSIYYGRLVIAPLNIVKYNIFGGAGPNLYGVEPFSYYLINGFLNFNVVWLFALSTPILLMASYIFIPSRTSSTLYFPHYLSLAPLFIWLFVFWIQPHKEERFLFPIYPMVCLCGAISVDVVQRLYLRIASLVKQFPTGSHYINHTTFITAGAILLSALLGVSRIVSLYRNYQAPMTVLMELGKFRPPDAVPVYLCYGKEWHRFPSSFFLPNDQWEARLVPSAFTGMLPMPFPKAANATSTVSGLFNDANRASEAQHFDLNKCDFLVDFSDGVETQLEPNYAAEEARWELVKSVRFLNARMSGALHRSFYIPFFSDERLVFDDYVLLQSRRSRVKPVE